MSLSRSYSGWRSPFSLESRVARLERNEAQWRGIFRMGTFGSPLIPQRRAALSLQSRRSLAIADAPPTGLLGIGMPSSRTQPLGGAQFRPFAGIGLHAHSTQAVDDVQGRPASQGTVFARQMTKRTGNGMQHPKSPLWLIFDSITLFSAVVSMYCLSQLYLHCPSPKHNTNHYNQTLLQSQRSTKRASAA